MTGLCILTEAEYRAHPAINISKLKHGLRSMATLRHAIDHPDETTKAMNLGSLLHAIVLQPDKVEELFAIAPTLDGRTKEGKAAKAEFEKSAAGKIIVSNEDVETANAMAASIFRWAKDPANIEPASILNCRDAVAERSVFWTEKAWSGGIEVECKGRIDWFCPYGTEHIEGPVILDLKTARDGSPAEWDRVVSNFNYHMQAAWYRRGISAISGGELPRFVFLVVESEAPYLCSAYELTPEALAIGDEQCADLLSRYARAKASNNWPGYPSGINPCSLPVWRMVRHAEDASNSAAPAGWGEIG